jgi:putative ABC transport system ATP-binding protein
MIQLSAIEVTFNPKTPLVTRALTSVDLTIPARQFVTVIGSNGAGKSTLLNVLSGDVIPEKGKVWIEGQDVTQWPVSRCARLVGRVFQNPLTGSCANLTIEENLALAYRRGQERSFSRALTSRVRSQFREQLAGLELGLENRLSDRMKLLSGGQRQAVCLLMSTLAPSQILLLDEHTAALDPKTATDIMQLTQQIVAERGLTTLMVTHSMRQALAFGDRTIMLHEGQIILDVSGAERSQLSVPDLVSRFNELRAENLASDRLLLD